MATRTPASSRPAGRRREAGGCGAVACGAVRRSAGAVAAGLEAHAVCAQPQQATLKPGCCRRNGWGRGLRRYRLGAAAM